MPVAETAVNVSGPPGGFTTGGVNRNVRRDPSAADVSAGMVPATYRLFTAVAEAPLKVGAGVPLCAAVIEPTVPTALLEEKPNCGLCELGSAAPAALMLIAP